MMSIKLFLASIENASGANFKFRFKHQLHFHAMIATSLQQRAILVFISYITVASAQAVSKTFVLNLGIINHNDGTAFTSSTAGYPSTVANYKYGNVILHSTQPGILVSGHVTSAQLNFPNRNRVLSKCQADHVTARVQRAEIPLYLTCSTVLLGK